MHLFHKELSAGSNPVVATKRKSRMTNEELLARAIEFDAGNPAELNGMIVEDDDDIKSHYRVFISLRDNTDGKKKWAIHEGGSFVLSKRGDWVYEPMPSSRTKSFLKRTRFDSIEEAFAALDAYKKRRRKQLRKAGAQTYKEFLEKVRTNGPMA